MYISGSTCLGEISVLVSRKQLGTLNYLLCLNPLIVGNCRPNSTPLCGCKLGPIFKLLLNIVNVTVESVSGTNAPIVVFPQFICCVCISQIGLNVGDVLSTLSFQLIFVKVI